MQTFDIKQKSLYIVSIEWDGKQPPSRWYRRLDGLGLRVSGNKDLGPIERRQAKFWHEGRQVSAVIYQEGVIMISSYSLARGLALLARRLGAVNVDVSEANVMDRITASRQDERILGRIEKTLGRRGRPPAKKRWAVTCLECMTVTDQEVASPVNCHNCGGLRIHARKGGKFAVLDNGGDIVDLWLQSRFTGSHWEPAEITTDPDHPHVFDAMSKPAALNRDYDALDVIAGSPVLESIRKMDRETAVLFLDAIFVNLQHYTREERLEKRLKALVSYYQMGGDRSVDVDEPQGADLLTAAGPLMPRFVASSIIALGEVGEED